MLCPSVEDIEWQKDEREVGLLSLAVVANESSDPMFLQYLIDVASKSRKPDLFSLSIVDLAAKMKLWEATGEQFRCLEQICHSL